jgi:hypothetical protein
MTSGATVRYVRRLSAMERYSLVINEVYRYHVDAVVQASGTLDPETLRKAIAVAAEANPGVRVRLRGVLGFCRWVDSGIPPALRVIDYCVWDGGSEQGAEFLAPRLDPLRGGPVAEVIMARCRDGKTRLVFRGVHAAFDGRGMQHWLIEVFRALRGDDQLGSASTLTDLDVQERMKEQVTDAQPPGGACIPVLTPGGAGDLAYVWRRIVIPRNVSHILAKASVFLAAWARQHGEGEVGFTVPVDYRGLRIDEMGIGNLTGYLRLTIGENDTARTVMQQLNQRVRALADCRTIPGIKAILWLPLRYMVKKLLAQLNSVLYTVNPHLPTGGLVSMGLLKTEWFSCPGFQAEEIYAIPGAVGKLNVVFVNFRDYTIVSFAAPAAYNLDGQLDAMIKAFQQNFSANPHDAALE